MKKNLVFLSTALIFLGLASFAFAITLNNPLGDITFVGLICKIVNYIGTFLAALAGLMFVIAGIFYVTSAGDPSKVQKAKDILKAAIIGTAIALAATGLINLIANILTGTTIGTGCPG